LRIVGIALSPEYIYQVGAGSIFPDDRRFGVLWMSHKAVSNAFDMDGAFNDVTLSLQPGANAKEVMAQLDRQLNRYGGIGAYDREEQISHRFISDEISQNRITSTWVPAIFFSVAAFLLHIVLSRLVTLQRGEIGILKAFGYRNAEIGFHYVKLALTVIAIGIALGLPTGLYFGNSLTALYRDYYRFPRLAYVSSSETIAIAVGVSIIVATFGALWAVRAAVGLPPAEAMRPAPPATFRAGFIERLGIYKYFSPAWRMIARNVSRRPWKALMSIVGVAFAAGILVVGGFFLDAIDYLLRVQFEIVQRDDLTVLFREPRARSSVFEMRELPGVLEVEPFRTVPARLRYQHRWRRIDLVGVESTSDLHRLIDQQLETIALPPEGIILNRMLAKILDVRPGDMITVEVLGGRRSVWDLPVAGLVDELTGLSVYINRHALARLLEEDDAMSGAYLAVDPGDTDRLYALLKRMPAVSGVSIRAAMLVSFKAIIARSIRISTLINVFFSCVIAFGVIYNSGRIALSERANELASLRILGFSRREVNMILLGEQAALASIAIPAGLVLGYGFCALLARRLATELYRIPLIVSVRTFAFAVVVVVCASALSSLLVAWRMQKLDLIAVLKTRE
jgi:putative ABC transport system permease protein